jgi:alkaline phosphatase
MIARLITTTVLLALALTSSCQKTIPATHPKNVILMIGDGMGYNCVLAADYYFGPSPLNAFPYKAAVSTTFAGLTYDPTLAWSDPSYLTKEYTESAAAATALATGFKTTLNTIGLSPAGDTVMNLTEYAKLIGKSAGVITSVPISHATPAAFLVHNKSRSNYPQIAKDILFNSRCDLVMGCGNPEFDDDGNPMENDWTYAGYVGDSAMWKAVRDGSGTLTSRAIDGNRWMVRDINGDGTPDPWTVITSLDEIRKLATEPTPVRVLACPEVNSTLQQGRKGDGKETNDSPPFSSPLNSNVPTLAEMVRGGLNVLDNNPEGFFLMVEGGAIDWANHSNQKGRMLEEMKSFRDAIETVISWVQSNSSWDETLLIVTADHESGNLWGGPVFTPVTDNGIGNMPVLQYNSYDHTNCLVPIYAWGNGGSLLLKAADETDPARGVYLQNNEIPNSIFSLWKRK